MKLKLSNKLIHSLSIVLCLCSITIINGMVFAEESDVDNVAVNIPVACTMTGTGMNSHTATIPNGTVNSNIGETTIKAYCNDADGFAVYAIGYTSDTDGNNVLSDSTLGSTYDIVTGTSTSGNTSNWAMKLSTVTSPTPSFPITIESDQSGSFSSFHAVPDDYTKVAKRTSATDTGQNAEGSTLKTTYQAFISQTQLAGTYTGQVKYVLVHPNYVDSSAFSDAVTVIFDGNGLTFPDGSTTNTVKYANVCKPAEYGYVGSNYQEVMTSNITAGGTQNGSYTNQEHILQPITFSGADKLKVVVDYALTADTAGISVAKGSWDGNWSNKPEVFYDIYNSSNNISGTEAYIINGNTTTIYIESWDTPIEGYNKGAYIKVYPVYNTEQPGTTGEELPSYDCYVHAIAGNYLETDPWKGKWIQYHNEDDVKGMITSNYNVIKGTTITIQAHNPYILKYNGNGASNEIGMGTHQYYTRIYDDFDFHYGWMEELQLDTSIMLIAPNYKRSGYGFIGWSTDQNAANHISSATLYGPNQTITIDQALLDTANSNREVTMYATWLPSAGNLQNWNGCSSMSIGGVTALTDTRDNNTYAVAKLADEKCWMIENLRLGGDSPMTLTTNDTQSAGILPAATYGDNWLTYPTDTRQMSNINTAQPESIVTNVNQKNYAFGNHYSWFAASSVTERAESILDYDNTSICPKGWRLPNSGEFRGLISNNTLEDFPNNFVRSGFVSDEQHGVFDNRERGSVAQINTGHATGFYWTSTATHDTSVSCDFADDASPSCSNSMNPSFHGTDGSESDGFTIRCVSLTGNE